ncbi:MFS transporter [Bradyrhizobium sp.]|uniref:MFS transporter n=1 Tax=Bradyrhizobium sp. TaxID=376 RepID=UPI0039E3031E
MPVTLETTTLRKVTWRIIPFLVLCYFLAFVDRINVGIAALTMNRDLGLSPAVFGFGAGLFFVSYFFLEVPSNILMQKVGARRWIARIMISWGIVSGATAFVQGTTSFYAVRLLLGAAEAGFFPAILFYLSCWFPERARAKVFAYFLAAVPLAGIIGFPVSGIFLALDGIWGLKGWQWLFLIEALPTLIVAIVAYYYLTDHPGEATWLSDEQRKWLLDQLAQDERQRKGRAKVGNWVNLLDVRVICFATIHFCGNLAIYGLGFFLPQIVKASGFSNFDASLVSALPYILGAVGMLFWGWYSAAGRARMGVFLPFVVGTIGFIGAAASGNPVLMIASLCVASFGALGYAPGFWTLPTSLLSGTASAIAIAAINSVGNFAGFLGPYTIGYLRETTGSFDAGLFASAAVMAIAALLVLVATRSSRSASASVPQDVEVDAVSAPH